MILWKIDAAPRIPVLLIAESAPARDSLADAGTTFGYQCERQIAGNPRRINQVLTKGLGRAREKDRDGEASTNRCARSRATSRDLARISAVRK